MYEQKVIRFVIASHITMVLHVGSRSSPLTLAAAMHPRAQIVVCIDERSLAFWALGYGKAKRCPRIAGRHK